MSVYLESVTLRKTYLFIFLRHSFWVLESNIAHVNRRTIPPVLKNVKDLFFYQSDFSCSCCCFLKVALMFCIRVHLFEYDDEEIYFTIYLCICYCVFHSGNIQVFHFLLFCMVSWIIRSKFQYKSNKRYFAVWVSFF